MLRRLTLLRRFRWRRILDANDPKNAQDGQGPQQQEDAEEEEEDERRGSRLSRTHRESLEQEFQISAWLPAPRADEIAARLGYQDTRNFSRSFRRWHGSTPSTVRRLHGA